MKLPDDQTDQTGGEENLEQYADRTRKSLIMRLQDWQDQRSWDEFYRTYWRLIYSVALKAGLRQEEAWDVVQETVLSIAKQSRRRMYDPAQGSFKRWLWNMTRWRINDQFRSRKKDTAMPLSGGDSAETDPMEGIPDSNESFERIWEAEWKNNLMKAALERVKMRVSPKQFQIFNCNVVLGMAASEIRERLHVSSAQVYLAKHRVGSVLKKELEYLRQQEREPEQ
ncbi:MAG: sigma-70 family RNA polymerase sigma factor [Akkermansia sp.]|nr:sigma-70 family RNA polymerase sigma factor [Akkermansia sp.]MCD8070079.1 sigma-70 family RNA polymerase sigma factor [Akkermansiaceae bacterium]